jgi:hypothetical protein
MKKHKFSSKIENGRIKIYIDDLLHVVFNQSDFRAIYSYNIDKSLYGIDIILKDSLIELEYINNETSAQILKELDTLL